MLAASSIDLFSFFQTDSVVLVVLLNSFFFPKWASQYGLIVEKYNLASPVSTFTRRPNAILYPFPTGKVFLEITCACCKLN